MNNIRVHALIMLTSFRESFMVEGRIMKNKREKTKNVKLTSVENYLGHFWNFCW